MSLKKISASISLAATLASSCALSFNDGIFHEYDVRGEIGKEFEPSDTYRIGQGIASYVLAKKPAAKKIAVGMDGRTHSPAIKKYLTDGIISSGLDVIYVGMCTTPVIYFTMHNLNVDAGIMITASHNPAQYNGLKISLGTEPVFGPELKDIKERVKSGIFSVSNTPGTVSEHSMIEPYLDWLENQFSHLKGLEMSMILDCGNGAAGTVIPDLVKRMNWPNVKLMYAEVDGTYPNHVADPTVIAYMEDLKQELANSDAVLGMGFDGDADRMSPMTKDGTLVTGDKLLALFAQPLLKQYPGMPVLFDVSSSLSLVDLIRAWGGKAVMSQTGISHIKKAMKEQNSLLGGEISCHFVFKDRQPGFDDGVYAALRLVELLNDTQASLEELLSIYPKSVGTPLYRIPCEQKIRLAVVESLKQEFVGRNDVEVVTVDGVRVNFVNGWGIVRLSNTEPLLSMRFEGYSQNDLDFVKKSFAKVLRNHIDCTFLS